MMIVSFGRAVAAPFHEEQYEGSGSFEKGAGSLIYRSTSVDGVGLPAHAKN
ncbi:hypothetical protein M8R20_21565 [Pseudomonas sp. R2.Fl]|nr:hypothetical protein [Pseudomonas sp. R2.Fl]